MHTLINWYVMLPLQNCLNCHLKYYPPGANFSPRTHDKTTHLKALVAEEGLLKSVWSLRTGHLNNYYLSSNKMMNHCAKVFSYSCLFLPQFYISGFKSTTMISITPVLEYYKNSTCFMPDKNSTKPIECIMEFSTS